MEKLIQKLIIVAESVGKITAADVAHIEVRHEDGCPAILTQRLLDCTCEPEADRRTRLFQ